MLQYNTPSYKPLPSRYTKALPVEKKEWKEQPVKEITCNINPTDKPVSDINFIMDEPTVFKIIEYRKLEIIKKLEIFKLNIVLFSNLCMHIKVAIQKGYEKEFLDLLIQKKEIVGSYIQNFMLDSNQNYLLKCKNDIIFLEEQLLSKTRT